MMAGDSADCPRSPETPPVTDTPTLTPAAGPAAPANVTVGFLSVVTDSSGVYGGYLLTNAWGRPLEFRLSTAVQPNRVQQILYGPTLAEYLHADLIGKTLVEKAVAAPGLIVADSLPALGLWGRLGVMTVSVAPAEGSGFRALTTPRSSVPVTYPAKHAGELGALTARLEQLDPAVDLSEPFARIREAMAEARKLGVANRAA